MRRLFALLLAGGCLFTAVLFAMGFSDFRVRLRDGGALLQFTEEQQRRAQEMLGEITTELLKHFETIKIDLKAREKSK